MRKTISLALGLAVFTAAVIAGCDNATPPKSDTPPAKQPEVKGPATNGDSEHAHKPGEHGGTIVEIGRDNYHAEAVFEKDGVVRLYTLGKDEARVEEVESQKLTAYAKAAGASEAVEFTFEPVPRPGDAERKTSQFVGTLPKEVWGKAVEVTVPSIRIDGARYRFGFASAAEPAHGEPMPAKVTNDEERDLYLTPGGKYTAADIKANGGVTASEKFKGQMAAHDRTPKPGDQICPITDTKANPKFSWVVGGKTYQFCCPPCVDDFVKRAKEKPDEIKDPGEYVKK